MSAMWRLIRRLWRALWRRRHPWLHAVECSWCQLYRPGKESNVTGWSTAPHSSGLCPECRLRVLADNFADRSAT